MKNTPSPTQHSAEVEEAAQNFLEGRAYGEWPKAAWGKLVELLAQFAEQQAAPVATLSGEQADKSWECGDGNKTFHHTPRPATLSVAQADHTKDKLGMVSTAPTQRSGEVLDQIQHDSNVKWAIKSAQKVLDYLKDGGSPIGWDEMKNLATTFLYIASLEGSVPSRSAVQVAQQIFPAGTSRYNPADIERAATIIQQAINAKLEEAAKVADAEGWGGKIGRDVSAYTEGQRDQADLIARDIRSLAEQPAAPKGGE